MMQHIRRTPVWLLAVVIAGCVVAPASGWAGAAAGIPTGDSRGAMQFQGKIRTYVLHVPGSYTGARPAALVLDLHGGSGTGAGEERISHMAATADRHGFIAVFPDGYGRFWNDERGVTTAQKAG